MIHQHDYQEIRRKTHTFKERAEEVYVLIRRLCKKYDHCTIVYGTDLAFFFETGDYGIPQYDPNPAPRCDRGYYAQFYVSTVLKPASALVVHDGGVEAVEFLNFDEHAV